MSVDGGASGMRDQNRLCRCGDALRSGPIPAVAEIDGHSEIVHPFNSGDSRFTQAGIAGFEASIAEEAAIVVGELHHPHAELAKHIYAFGIFLEERSVLKAGYNSDFAFALGASNVGMATHDEKRLGMLLYQHFDNTDATDRGFEGWLRYGEVDRSNSGLPHRTQRFGRRRCVQFGERSTEGVDDDGILIKLDDGTGVG